MLNIDYKPFMLLLILLVFGFALADDTTSAANVSEDDVVVTLDLPIVSELADESKIDQVGDTLYNTQEDSHELIKETTGKEIKHFYIHVCLGKKACLPIDPFRFSN